MNIKIIQFALGFSIPTLMLISAWLTGSFIFFKWIEIGFTAFEWRIFILASITAGFLFVYTDI